MAPEKSIIPRERVLRGVIPLSLLLAGCASTTTEGVATRECIESEAVFNLRPGQHVYLGDLSSHEFFSDGRHNDWFEITNRAGAVTFRGQQGDTGDDGEVRKTRGGFDYTENDKTYHVTYDNNPHDIHAAVEVTVKTDCK